MVSLLTATAIIILLTFLPALELRFSILVGILSTQVTLPFFGPVQGFGLPWWYVLLIAVAANILVAVCVYAGLHFVVERLLVPRWAWFARFYHRRLEKAQKRIHKHVERWGWLGLAVFIAIPLPGSGVYTGALAAFALGMGFWRFMAASTLGVLTAGILVTLFATGIAQVVPFL